MSLGFGRPNGSQYISGVFISTSVSDNSATTVVLTQTVIQTGLLTSSGVSTNSPPSQAGVSSIPSATETRSDSNVHRFNHQSFLGPIVGGVVAVFALILLFILLLLKHRASQRAIRLRAEIDPTPTAFVLDRGRLGRHVSVNVDGSRSEMPSPTVHSSQMISPESASLKRARTNYTGHSPIHDERIHLASELEYTSEPNSLGHFQSNSSHDLITNSAITEMTHTATYIPDQSPTETHIQTNFTNISTDSDYASNSAPPAYDSLPTPITRVNSSQPKP